MNETIIRSIASELSLKPEQVFATVLLLNSDATVPFIARYRKELTGNLDEVQITNIRDRAEQLHELEARKTAVIRSLKELNKLNPALEKAVLEAATLAKVEDLYLPFRPKKQTRASAAKEKGLEPLADMIMKQDDGDAFALARPFVDPQKNVTTLQDALSGARDIIAERISEDADIRGKLRQLYLTQGKISSTVMKSKEKEEAAQKFRDYFSWEEPVSTIPSHRMLAIRRGREEGFLVCKIVGVEQACLDLLRTSCVKKANPCGAHVWLAAQDAYQRLLSVSIQADAMIELRKRADKQAIQVFAQNLRELLLASPLGQKNVMGIDPGYRTGCKVVCLDAQGKLLADTVIYPTKSDLDRFDAEKQLTVLCNKFDIEAIAIGNGTAGRETEAFVWSLGFEAQIVVVNEAGASVYSASDIARAEFPDKDITVRGAVSIGRRLMDPLAELVKIDPKSIGVGQYQHDVDQVSLKRTLDDVVVSCVNAVGVDVNTASKELLTYVSGLGPRLAQSIIDYRNQNGPFPDREKLKQVPSLGSRAFEQAAGFLRVSKSANCLDASAVHPERYGLVENIARDLGCSVEGLMKEKSLREKIKIEKYVSTEVGLPTLQDILKELDKPGRDPRQKFEAFAFAEGVHELTDLREGMSLPGIVTNVAAFGAFVDIGVHQDGLAHISELSDNFVKDPMDVVKVGQKVKVTVTAIDLDRRRIALSMKTNPVIGKIGPNDRPKAATGGMPQDWQDKLSSASSR